MIEKTAAIVGSGIVGTTIAHHLVMRGYRVDVFEKGPECRLSPFAAVHREDTLLLRESILPAAADDPRSVTGVT